MKKKINFSKKIKRGLGTIFTIVLALCKDYLEEALNTLI